MPRSPLPLLSLERRARQTALVALVAGAAFWVLDSAVDALLSPGSFRDELLTPSRPEVWIRLLVTVLVVLLWRARLARSRFHLLWSALEAAPDGIQITNLDGSIAYSNPAVEDIYGFTPAEFQGRHVNELNADPTAASRVILPAIGRYGHWEGELEVKHKTGEIFPIWLTASVVKDGRGHPMAAIGVIRDVSELKRAERELREYAHELEQATALKDLFADILRHDLVGPASTVQLAVESLLRRTPEQDPTRRMLETARRSCAKLIDMVNGAATYAKLSTATGIEFKEVDLGAVLREVVADFDPRRDGRRTVVLLDAPGIHLFRGNPMIAEVFDNLLSNASKYGPEGGLVRIEVLDEGARWKVCVIDAGEGIPDADKEKVFGRFERLRKEGVKGTGLGLAIARRIVELHGGRIWVEDAPGGGACVCVALDKLA
jgi:PAS domain S-box-containing protein